MLTLAILDFQICEMLTFGTLKTAKLLLCQISWRSAKPLQDGGRSPSWIFWY